MSPRSAEKQRPLRHRSGAAGVPPAACGQGALRTAFRRKVLRFSILQAALVVTLSLPAAAQQSAHPMTMAPGMHMTETPSAYPLGLGEVMTAFVQPRHLKLGLAGQEHNWAYVAYELDELTETFDDIAKYIPTHDNMAIPPMIASTVKPPLAALDAAVQAKNAAAFTKAYAELTMACNACHQSVGHPMIVIRVPGGGPSSPFPDQDFRAQK